MTVDDDRSVLNYFGFNVSLEETKYNLENYEYFIYDKHKMNIKKKGDEHKISNKMTKYLIDGNPKD